MAAKMRKRSTQVGDVRAAQDLVDGHIRGIDAQEDGQRHQREEEEQGPVLTPQRTGNAGERDDAADRQRGPLQDRDHPRFSQIFSVCACSCSWRRSALPRVCSRSPARARELAVGQGVEGLPPRPRRPACFGFGNQAGGDESARKSYARRAGGRDRQLRGEPVGGQLRRIVLRRDAGGGRDAVPQLAVVDRVHPVPDRGGVRGRAQRRAWAAAGHRPAAGAGAERSMTARSRSMVAIWLTSSAGVGGRGFPASSA